MTVLNNGEVASPALPTGHTLTLTLPDTQQVVRTFPLGAMSASTGLWLGQSGFGPPASPPGLVAQVETFAFAMPSLTGQLCATVTVNTPAQANFTEATLANNAVTRCTTVGPGLPDLTAWKPCPLAIGGYCATQKDIILSPEGPISGISNAMTATFTLRNLGDRPYAPPSAVAAGCPNVPTLNVPGPIAPSCAVARVALTEERSGAVNPTVLSQAWLTSDFFTGLNAGALQPRATQDVTLSFNWVPQRNSDLTALRLYIDYFPDIVDEADDAVNNISKWRPADLVLKSVVQPGTGYCGGGPARQIPAPNMLVTVKNEGAAMSGPFRIRLNLWREKTNGDQWQENENIDGGQDTFPGPSTGGGAVPVGYAGLAPYEERTITIPVNQTYAGFGSGPRRYLLQAVVDPYNVHDPGGTANDRDEVVETQNAKATDFVTGGATLNPRPPNPSNNYGEYSFTVHVPAPDLSVVGGFSSNFGSGIQVDAPYSTASPRTVTVRVQNLGEIAAQPGDYAAPSLRLNDARPAPNAQTLQILNSATAPATLAPGAFQDFTYAWTPQNFGGGVDPGNACEFVATVQPNIDECESGIGLEDANNRTTNRLADLTPLFPAGGGTTTPNLSVDPTAPRHAAGPGQGVPTTVRGGWRNEGNLIPATYTWALNATDTATGATLALSPSTATTGTESGPARYTLGAGTTRSVTPQLTFPEKFVRNNNPADIVYSPPTARPAAAQIGTLPAQYSQSAYTASLSLTVDTGGGGGVIPECTEGNNVATIQVPVHVPRINLTAWATLESPNFVSDVFMGQGPQSNNFTAQGVRATITNTGDLDAGNIFTMPAADMQKCDVNWATYVANGDACGLAQKCANPTNPGVGGTVGVGVRLPDAPDLELRRLDANNLFAPIFVTNLAIPKGCSISPLLDYLLRPTDQNLEVFPNRIPAPIFVEFRQDDNDSSRRTPDAVPMGVSSP